MAETNSPNLSFGKWISHFMALGGKYSLTVPYTRTLSYMAVSSHGSISTAAGHWKCRWHPGWGWGWEPAPLWSPVRKAPLRGPWAMSSVTSCLLSHPPSGSGSPPLHWRGRAGGCDLVKEDKIQLVNQRGGKLKLKYSETTEKAASFPHALSSTKTKTGELCFQF